MPLLRRVQLTSICGSKTCARTGATDVISASATPINLTISPFPMTPRSFVCVRANCEHIGEDQTRCKGSQARSQRRGSHLRNVVGEAAHTAFAPALPSPLRKTAPYGRPVHRLGDCAGRSPGSRVVALVVRPSQFPSGRNGPKARRLQLRGQPRMASNSSARICRVRVPSFVPDLSRGTSTAKCSLETLRRVKRPLQMGPASSPFTILLFPGPRD